MKFLKFIFLYPISLLYGLGVQIRNFLFDTGVLKSTEFDIPVITVGNITVGGTGKTPMVEYLITLLKNKYKIAVLSRGYKRKTKGFILADKESDVLTIGDEPYQILLKFPDIIVAVDEKRVRGIKNLMNLENKPDIIILDDAFQHRYVRPALSLLLIDYSRPFLKDRYLPYGRLRDNQNQRYRAELIMVTKAPRNIKPIDMRITASDLKLKPYQSLYFSAIDYKGLMPVYSNEIFALDGEVLKQKEYAILLVTGIGNPAPIINYCKSLTKKVSVLSFKDHYQYTEKDIARIIKAFNIIDSEHKIIVTTEKDAVRFRLIKIEDAEITKRFYYYPIEMKILNKENDEFKKQIHYYIQKSKQQSRFLSTRKNY